MDLKGLVERVDRFQQRHPVVAFPFAVVKKFGDDQAGYLAALIAYYGFFSLFPLLLVFYTVLGLVLQGNPRLQEEILRSALRDFPVIGQQLQVKGVAGSGAALAVGIAGTLWAGLGVTQAAQNAMNRVWAVPRTEWPNFLWSRLRGLAMLAILGSITVCSFFLSGLGASGGALSVVLRAVGVAGSLTLNFVLYLLAFRVLTARDVSWGDIASGAAVAAILWTVLQMVGGYYVTHQLRNASDVYGTFALVIGLLVWIYLGAQVTLFCAEINVVRVLHLWPRSISSPPFTPGDEGVLRGQAEQQKIHPQESIEVTFADQAESDRRS